MSKDRAIRLLRSGAEQAEQEMMRAGNRDEYIFACGQFSAMSAIFIMLQDDTLNSEMAALVVNKKIQELTERKYGK